MQHIEDVFQGSEGVALYAQSWLPEGEAAADIVILHGFGEHSNRYGYVAKFLTREGFAVHSFDLRGHGKSQGRRGDVTAWDVYRQDIVLFLQKLTEKAPGRKIFLYGHSMGGLLALDYVLHGANHVGGLIASGPLLEQARLSPVMVALSRLLLYVAPSMNVDVGLDATSISRDQDVVTAYVEDPLVHSKATPRMGHALEQTIDWCQEHAGELNVPIYVVYGEDDRLVPPRGTEAFYTKLEYADREKYIVPAGYHEPHNDLDKQDVMERIAAWLRAHL